MSLRRSVSWNALSRSLHDSRPAIPAGMLGARALVQFSARTRPLVVAGRYDRAASWLPLPRPPPAFRIAAASPAPRPCLPLSRPRGRWPKPPAAPPRIEDWSMPYEVTFATGRRVTVYNAEFLKHEQVRERAIRIHGDAPTALTRTSAAPGGSTSRFRRSPASSGWSRSSWTADTSSSLIKVRFDGRLHHRRSPLPLHWRSPPTVPPVPPLTRPGRDPSGAVHGCRLP